MVRVQLRPNLEPIQNSSKVEFIMGGFVSWVIFLYGRGYKFFEGRSCSDEYWICEGVNVVRVGLSFGEGGEVEDEKGCDCSRKFNWIWNKNLEQ